MEIKKVRKLVGELSHTFGKFRKQGPPLLEKNEIFGDPLLTNSYLQIFTEQFVQFLLNTEPWKHLRNLTTTYGGTFNDPQKAT